MVNPFHQELPICPACRSQLRFHFGRCAYCQSPLHVPQSYFRWVWCLTFVPLGLIGVVTYNSEHAGRWLLILIALLLPIRIVYGLLVPATFEIGTGKRRLPLFLASYLGSCLFLLAYWSVWGWLHVLLRASNGEFQENLDFFSLPLGMISRALVITPSKTFADVCGILFGNAFFYALVMFALYRFGHSLIQRNRVTRMDLSTPDSPNEEDED